MTRNKEIYEKLYAPPVFYDNGKRVKVTLESLGKEYGISGERIRQIALQETRRRVSELKDE